MNGRWMIKLLAVVALSAATAGACDQGAADDSQSPTLDTTDATNRSCKTTSCVVGLEPDLEHGTVAESICSCTEVDFWNLVDECNPQGGTVVAAGSCGKQTPSCDATTLNCVIPAPTTPEVVDSECECGDETQFWEFFGECQDLGGEVSTVFPTGHEQVCTP